MKLIIRRWKDIVSGKRPFPKRPVNDFFEEHYKLHDKNNPPSIKCLQCLNLAKDKLGFLLQQ